MKVWTATIALVALGGTVFSAAFLGARWRVGGEGFSGALANAQRSEKPRQAPSRTPSAASAAGEPAPISPESLAPTPSFRQTNTYNGNVVFVPEGCHGPYDLILHFHGAHPYVREAVE